MLSKKNKVGSERSGINLQVHQGMALLSLAKGTEEATLRGAGTEHDVKDKLILELQVKILRGSYEGSL